MKDLRRKIILFTMMFSVILQGTFISAHSGEGHSFSGHHDYKNTNGSGSSYYHHGHDSHFDSNGSCPYDVCPYDTCPYSSTKTPKLNKSQQEVKKCQKMLNELGYTCGTPNGLVGSKSKQAVRKFQKKHNLTVTGTFNKKTKKKIKEQYDCRH